MTVDQQKVAKSIAMCKLKFVFLRCFINDKILVDIQVVQNVDPIFWKFCAYLPGMHF